MNAKLWKEFLLTRKIELFLSSDSIEGPEFDWGYCCQRVRLGGASPEPELWPPSRLQLAPLRRNQTRAPAGKYFSTISEIIWRAENMRGHLLWERSLVSIYRVTGGIWTFSLHNAIIVIHGIRLPELMEEWRTGSRTFSPRLQQKWGRPDFLSRCVQTCTLQNAKLTSFR